MKKSASSPGSLVRREQSKNPPESTSAHSLDSFGPRFDADLALQALGAFLLGFDPALRLGGWRLLIATRLGQEHDHRHKGGEWAQSSVWMR
jgi:hypothetical protein